MAVMELRKKSQITIPKDIIEALKLHEGDKEQSSDVMEAINKLQLNVR